MDFALLFCLFTIYFSLILFGSILCCFQILFTLSVKQLLDLRLHKTRKAICVCAVRITSNLFKYIFFDVTLEKFLACKISAQLFSGKQPGLCQTIRKRSYKRPTISSRNGNVFPTKSMPWTLILLIGSIPASRACFRNA